MHEYNNQRPLRTQAPQVPQGNRQFQGRRRSVPQSPYRSDEEVRIHRGRLAQGLPTFSIGAGAQVLPRQRRHQEGTDQLQGEVRQEARTRHDVREAAVLRRGWRGRNQVRGHLDRRRI